MPKISSPTPDGLKPYKNLGIDLEYREGDKEAIGECPFCGKEGKFSVDIKQGVYRCFSCMEGSRNGGGNARIFVRKYWEMCFSNTSDYSALASSRGIRDTTLIRWGVCRGIDGQWLIPAYGSTGEINTLYRYSPGGKLYATGELGSGYFRPDSFPRYASTLYICEGPWDGMALWETLGTETSSTVSVIAVPGAGTFSREWLKAPGIFYDSAGGDVGIALLFDNDHPRIDKERKNPKTILGAGYLGMKRAAGILTEAGIAPDLVSYLNWGEKGYDPYLPSGFDLRDVLTGVGSDGNPLNSRFKAPSTSLERFEELERRITLIPKEWILGHKNSPKNSEKSEKFGKSGGDLPPLPCDSYKTLVESWEKAMEWTPGLDCALSVMLACALSTQRVGEQLWCKIISPPATGKTTLLEGLSVSKQYVFSKDTIRGFYTGWAGGSEDLSIAALANGKTLAIKDGDTLLKSPNLSQILSEGRGLYDGAGRTHYRNTVSHEYEGHRMTWLLCGTSALREIDDSELGSRFLDCVIMEGIDDEFEKSVGLRAGEQELQNILMESNGVAEERHNPHQTKAMQLTGGYVNYLRENSNQVLSSVVPDTSIVAYCNALASFVSRMRARPSRTQEEESTREFSARLAKQLVRLSISLAAVMNRDRVDAEVKQRVVKIARDTSRGITLEIAAHLYSVGKEGYLSKSLGILTDTETIKMNKLLRFLKKIKVVTNFRKEKDGVVGAVKWRLTPRMRELYSEVMGVEDAENRG